MKRLRYPIFLIICSGFFLEVIVRAFFTTETSAEESLRNIHMYRPNTEFCYTGRPRRPIEFNVCSKWNQLGFHGRDIPAEPSKVASPRIMVIGDSFTQAIHVPDGENFVAIAESIAGGYFYNFGRSGTGPLFGLKSLERYGDTIKPEIVIYAFYYNDLIDDFVPWKTQQGKETWSIDKQRFWVPFMLKSYELAFNGLRRRISPPRPWGETPYFTEALTIATDETLDVAIAWQNHFQNVEKIIDWCETHNAEFVYLELGHPILQSHSKALTEAGIENDPHLPITRMTRHAQIHGYQFIQTSGKLHGSYTYKYDLHYTRLGHKQVGEILGHAIKMRVKNFQLVATQ